MENLVQISNVSKKYGSTAALSSVTLSIPRGKIVGLIGPNGSGKTTLLRALTGLISYEGEISVLGIEPSSSRQELMKHTGVIHDISVLPPWMTVRQVVRFLEGLQPAFDSDKFYLFLKRTSIKENQKIRQLSKGMKTQLHLALVLSTNTRLLILDEPTHGLDILFRKELYFNVLNDYFDGNKSVLISTHQVEEVEHILSDVIFLREGQVILYDKVESLLKRYRQVIVPEDQAEQIRHLSPLTEQTFFGKKVFIIDTEGRELPDLPGEISAPSIADIFVAVMGGQS